MIFFTLNDDFNHEKQCNLLHNYHFKYTVIFIAPLLQMGGDYSLIY